MAILLVTGQTVGIQTGTTANLPAPPSIGNYVIVGVTSFGGPLAAGEITDNCGNTFTLVPGSVSGDGAGGGGSDIYAVYYAKIATTTGGTYTITQGHANTLGAAEFSGIAATSPIDVVTLFSNASAAHINPTPTTANAGELIFMQTSDAGNDGDAFTLDSGTLLIAQGLISSTQERGFTGYKIAGAAGAQSIGVTLPAATPIGAVAVSFIAATAAAAPAIWYDPIRVPNNKVGPMVLRRLFKRPPAPVFIQAPRVIPSYPNGPMGMNMGDDLAGVPYNLVEAVADQAVLDTKMVQKLVRMALPSYNDAQGISNIRALALLYKNDGYFVSYGVTGLSSPNNATTYAAWKAQVPSEAAWAYAHGIDRFYIGNEEDWQAQLSNFGTITDSTVRTDVLALATSLKALYPTMQIVYSSAQGTVAQWAALGTGNLDKLGFNMYDTLANFGPNIIYFMSQIGPKYFVSEWGSNYGYFDMVTSQGYTDWDYANDLATRFNILFNLGLESYFFAYRFGDNTRSTGNYAIMDNTNTPVPGYEQAFGAPAPPYPGMFRGIRDIPNKFVGPAVLRYLYRQPRPQAPKQATTTTPTNITKGLVYTVVTTPAAKTKGLVYAVKTTPSAKTKSLQYEIKTSHPLTKGLVYAIKTTPAAKTKALQYLVKTTPSAKTKSLQYEIDKVRSLTKSLQYTVKTTIGKTLSAKYTVKTTPAAKTLSLKYVVKTVPSAKTKSLTYEIKTSHPITKSLQYEVKVVRSSLTKGLIYVVKTTPTAKTKSLAYVVAQHHSLTKSLAYEVKTSHPLTKSLKYVVKTIPAAKTLGLTYRVKTVHPLTKSLLYIVRTTHPITKTLTYEVIRHPALTKGLVYTLKRPMSITKSLQYKIIRIHPITKGLTYEVLRHVALTKGLQYEIRVVHPITKSLSYELRTTHPLTKSTRYIVLTSHDKTLSLSYAIKTQSSSRPTQLDQQPATTLGQMVSAPTVLENINTRTIL